MSNVNLENIPNNRKTAIEQSCKFYFTGKECKRGHVDARRVLCGSCIKCEQERNMQDSMKIYKKNYYSKNKIYIKNKTRNYRILHQEKYKKYSKNHYLINKSLYIERSLIWKQKNRKYINICRKEKRRNNAFLRLSHSTSTAIRTALKGNKNGYHWETLVGFTLKQLISHIESHKNFIEDDKITWESYGKYWHIDHIKPLSLCDTFEEAWSLQNLQPLRADINLSKGNRYIG